MSIIIVEGCDCTGKSSLIFELSKMMQFEYKHFSMPPNNISRKEQHDFCKNEYFNELDKIKKDEIYVFDRFYFGEQIYAPLYRNYSPDYIDVIEEELNKMNALLVLVYADEKTVIDRFDNVFIKRKDISGILNKYSDIFSFSNINNKMMIDTSHKSSVDCAREVFDEYKRIIQKSD